MHELLRWEWTSSTYTGQFKKYIKLSHVYNEVTSEPTITRFSTIVRKTQSLFVIDAGKCFGPPPPGETVLQNGDSIAKDVLYPAGTLPPGGGGLKHFPASITNRL
jgi:hypothetical protein